MKSITYYHAGCPVCIQAENSLVNYLAKTTEVKTIHLGEEKEQVTKAESLGVKSVPALLLEDGNVLHINFGASINDLK